MSEFHRTPPGKVEIAGLEPFQGLDLSRIALVTTAAESVAALKVLMPAEVVGFDTESKPTFRKGEKSDGPHVIQFATLERAYIFQSQVEESRPAILELLTSQSLKKVGFGLKGDLGHIWSRFGIRPGGVIDLDPMFRKHGYRNAVGARSAIAMLFQKQLAKSKSVTTSNWANPQLSASQLLYAANDAYAAIRVYHALRDSPEWPG